MVLKSLAKKFAITEQSYLNEWYNGHMSSIQVNFQEVYSKKVMVKTYGTWISSMKMQHHRQLPHCVPNIMDISHGFNALMSWTGAPFFQEPMRAFYDSSMAECIALEHFLIADVQDDRIFLWGCERMLCRLISSAEDNREWITRWTFSCLKHTDIVFLFFIQLPFIFGKLWKARWWILECGRIRDMVKEPTLP